MNDIDFQKYAKSLPLGHGVSLVKVDSKTGLIALSKPAGVKSHPNRAGVDKKALLAAPYDEAKECYQCELPGLGQVDVHLLHRLDSPTSGLVLIALEPHVADKVRSLFREGKVKKNYTALVKGKVLGKENIIWRDFLRKEKLGDKVRSRVGGGSGEKAETVVAVIQYYEALGVSLLKMEPKTGRTHQLRVQGQARKHPLVGDKTYGDFSFNKKMAKEYGLKGLCLHAGSLEVSWYEGGQLKKFQAQMSMPWQVDESQ